MICKNPENKKHIRTKAKANLLTLKNGTYESKNILDIKLAETSYLAEINAALIKLISFESATGQEYILYYDLAVRDPSEIKGDVRFALDPVKKEIVRK